MSRLVAACRRDLQSRILELWPGNRGTFLCTLVLGSGVEVTHRNLNDGVIEGIRCAGERAFSVQYHPEAGPGPHDARYLFDQFLELALA